MDVADRSSLPRRSAEGTGRQPLPTDVSALPALPAAYTSTLDHGLREIGLDLSPPQRAAIDAHVRLLVAWNEHINLSGLREPEAIARGHVLDALLAVPRLRSLQGHKGRPASLLDLGSGGGFPGIPLAVAMPARRAALVDSIAKKAAFLEAAARVVNQELNAVPDPPALEVFAERAEDLADDPDHREGWDLVLARAVGTVAECAELGLPLVRRGGSVAIWKRASEDAIRAALIAEIQDARRIVQAAGGAGMQLNELEPGGRVGLSGSCLVIIRKARPSPDRYPRSPGERHRGKVP